MILVPRNGAMQPKESRLRIKRGHWLEKDLLFVHSGRGALLYGKPVRPIDSAPLLRPIGSSANNNSIPRTPFSGAANFAGNASGYLEYETLGHSPQPSTLAMWFTRNGAPSATSYALSTGSATAGANAVRFTTTGSMQVFTSTSAGSTTQAGFTTADVSTDIWHFGAGVFVSNANRSAYLDDLAPISNATSRAPGATHDRIYVANARTQSGGLLGAAQAQLSGLALPIFIARALDAGEIARLYNEQRTRPWALFEPAPLQIWMGAAAPALPTLTFTGPISGTVTSTGWRHRVTGT